MCPFAMAPRRVRGRRPFLVHKPAGTLAPRVAAAGAQRFGILAVDCAKRRSKLLLVDFLGAVLLPPFEVEHESGALDAAADQVRAAARRHGLVDLVAAVERTGNYHCRIRDALAAAGFEVRIVHPFATKQLRGPANPGCKTDDTDLAAIARAATVGLGLVEPELPPLHRELRHLVRLRRDLVEKRSAVICQIKDRLHLAMPGFDACFADLFAVPAAAFLAREFGSAAALAAAGAEDAARRLRAAGIDFRQPTVDKALAWARGGPRAEHPEAAALRFGTALLDDDRQAKSTQIAELERRLAGLLSKTPYVLLLSIPGVNVVSAADCAGEIGPMSHYASHRNLKGRAGLFPSRSQSDRVDHADGPLVRCANRRLRAVLMGVADNLVKCNRHFVALAAAWRARGLHAGAIRVRAADRFSRIAFHMVGAGQVFAHPCQRGRDQVLAKLLAYCHEHDTQASATQQALLDAAEQLPRKARADEAAALTPRGGGTGGPRRLGELLAAALARRGPATVVQSESAGQDPS